MNGIKNMLIEEKSMSVPIIDCETLLPNTFGIR